LPASGLDGASALSLDGYNSLCVAGLSEGNRTLSDFAAVKYVLCASAKGDWNGSGDLTAADVVLMLRFLFNVDGMGSVGGDCNLCYADVNCNGVLSAADVVQELLAVFNTVLFPC